MENHPFECANALEKYMHPNRIELLTESNKKWLSHRLSENEWIEQVMNHTRELSPDRWKMVSLFCLTHQPVLLPFDASPGNRIACYLPDGCYLWPYMTEHMLQRSSEECGYHEERIVCLFLCMLEQQSTFNELLNDIEFIYDFCILSGYLPTTIDYLYKRLYMGTRMPSLISHYMSLPVHPEIRKSICHLGKFIIQISRFNGFLANELVEKFLSETIIVSDEEEWNTIVKCRESCGLSLWDKKKVNSVIPVKYGKHKWSFRWKTVQIRFHKKCYNERCDERIQWVSVWLRLVMGKKTELYKSPSHLICLLCNLNQAG